MTSARVIFLGTGDAFSSDARLSAGTLVEWRGQRFLIDPGPAVLVGMDQAGILASSIDRVLITHLHGDHIMGVPFLQLKRRYVENHVGAPLQILGPTGTRDRLALLWAATYPDTKGTQEPEVHEIPRRRHAFDVLGMTIEITPMVHLPHSIGFRMFMPVTDASGDSGIASIAFSGDTAFGECVVELAAGMQMTVLECTLLEREQYSHTSLAEVREHRERLQTRVLVLNHLQDRIQRAMEEVPIRGTLAAVDGEIMEIPVALSTRNESGASV